MRVLLLGGTGFVGAAVARQLGALGHEVAVFHRGRCGERAHVHGEHEHLESYAPLFAAMHPEAVVDLVAATATDARRTLRVFGGTQRRIVFISSFEVYRAWAIFHGAELGTVEPAPLAETAALRQHPNVFGNDKLGMERAASAWLAQSGPLPITFVRLPWLYGPGDAQRRLFPLGRRMHDGRGAILLSRNWAQWRRARAYVENAGLAIALAATHPRAQGRVYHVAEGEDWSELEWAQQVAFAAGWGGRLVVTAPAHTPAHLRVNANTAQMLTLDTRRIREDLGYRDVVPVRAALTATLGWEREHTPPAPHLRVEYAAEDAALRGLGLGATASLRRAA